MKKGQELIGVVEEVNFPNKGVVISEEGQKVIVKNVIVGETVRYRVSRTKLSRATGELLEVIKKADNELDKPNCIHFSSCGGCTYQQLSYDDQLLLKGKQVKKMMAQILTKEDDESFDAIWEGIKGSPKQFAYRNKMDYTFGDLYREGPLSLGMHKRGAFYDIVPVDSCCIVPEDFNIISRYTREFFMKTELTFYHKMKHVGYLRHMVLRAGEKTGEIMVNLITSTQIEREREIQLLDDYAQGMKELILEHELVGIIHTKNDNYADAVINEGTENLYGQDFFYEELLGLKFQVTPFSFFQTNSLGAEVLYSTVRDFVKDLEDKEQEGKGQDGQLKSDSIIYDLYSGTGTIAQLLAPIAKKVIGVEIIAEAVEAAKENAQLNHLDNCEFIAGDVLAELDNIEDKPDFIVLDPPRNGIHPKALKKIINYGVEHLIYVACKPTSLARDLIVFQENGYKVERIAAVDMFPGTVHVETVVLLSQQKPSDRIEVDLDLDELDVTSVEVKATYSEIKDYVLKEHGLKVTNLYISQIKRKCGLEVGENYNLAKSEDAKQPNCPEEKEKAIVDALKHFGMI